MSSRFTTVVPSLASVSREIDPQPFESLSPGVCSSTWHLPASPWKSPARGLRQLVLDEQPQLPVRALEERLAVGILRAS